MSKLITELGDMGVDWNTNTKKHAILYSQEFNWRIFPVHTPTELGCSCGDENCQSRGKHPRVKWREEATTDLKIIMEWFKQFPDMNLGISTGKVSDLIVVDADTHSGQRSLLGKEMKYTAVVKTGRGGKHYYYRYPPNTEIVKTRTGVLRSVDSRGDGGLVVAPCSLHSSGSRYEWIDCGNGTLPYPPEWWLELVQSGERYSNKEEIREKERNIVVSSKTKEENSPYVMKALKQELAKIYSLKGTKGGRNNQLIRSALCVFGFVNSGLLDEGIAKETLLDAALSISLSEKEAFNTINSAKKRAQPREIPDFTEEIPDWDL